MEIKIVYRRDDADINDLESLYFQTSDVNSFDLSASLYFTKHVTVDGVVTVKHVPAQIANYKIDISKEKLHKVDRKPFN